MLEAAERIVEFTRDYPSSFLGSRLVRDAVLRNFTVLGEAAKRVSPEFRALHAVIPWRRIAGFRDVLVHDYDMVDDHEVWRVIEHDLPDLVRLLSDLVGGGREGAQDPGTRQRSPD